MSPSAKIFWALLGISALAILLAFVVRAYALPMAAPVTPPPDVPVVFPVPQAPVPQALTQASCEAAGGEWNDCGSLCRGQPAGTVCADICVPQCNCGTSSGESCPSGFTCSDFLADASGTQSGICKADAQFTGTGATPTVPGTILP